MMLPKRLEFPTVSGQHMDGSIATHQEGEFTVVAAALERRVEDLFGIVEKWVHETLIVRSTGSVRAQGLAVGVEMKGEERGMAQTVSVIGVEAAELRWLRMLISLLRHPDPSVPELARQALVYLTEAAGKRNASNAETLNHAG
jgi:hypothetical protein